MTKLTSLLPFLLFSLTGLSQNFGEFASAVFVSECSAESFYNTSGSGSNCINPSCGVLFDGHNFGSFIQNSGDLYIGGAEIKTWKNFGGNVCGATLHYRVYPAGSPSGTFSTFNIPFKVNCCGAVFCDGLGGCGGNDQKWSEEALVPTVDLTVFAPGNWSVEIFISFSGDDFSSSGCGGTKFVNNGGTNYVADFTIASGTGSSCTILAADLHSLTSTCIDDYVLLEWDIVPDNLTQFIAIEKSLDGSNWDEIFRSQDYQLAQLPPQTWFEDRSFPSSDVYYRLIEYETTGNSIFFDVILNRCEYDTESYSISNSIDGENFLIVQGNDFIAPIEIEIFDTAGKIVFKETIQHNGQESAMYKLENLNVASGLFIARISRFDNVLQHTKFLR
ncbi:MAG: hypothetical protein AB8B56_05345 [Crocinitomicaceae bacterium]